MSDHQGEKLEQTTDQRKKEESLATQGFLLGEEV
jgi:hypothetical protein